MKPVIGFDLDGVLYPWHKVVYEYFEQSSPKIIGGRSFHVFWEDISNGTLEFSKLFWENLCGIEELYSSHIPDKAELDYLRTMAEDFTFYYITHRPCEFVTRTYLKRYNYPYQNNLIMVKGSKKPYVESLKCKYFVEDRPENIEDLKDITKVVVMRQPHNTKIRGQFTEIDTIFELGDIFYGI